jgi:predicted O-methyltransferase YrrM
MDTLQYFTEKFALQTRLKEEMPIHISQIGRYGLSYIFFQVGFKEGVEIGVEIGGFARWLFEHVHDLHLTCIDPWLSYSGYRTRLSQEQQENLFKMAQENLSSFNVTLIRDFSLNVVDSFAKNSLDFVFIDGNHEYKNVYEDITQWEKKVRPGGIIAGHDYVEDKRREQCDVIRAVNDYTRAHKISPWFILGEHRAKSYMWIKQ